MISSELVYHVRVETGHGAEPQFHYPTTHELREGKTIKHGGRSYVVLTATIDPHDPARGSASVRPTEG